MDDEVPEPIRTTYPQTALLEEVFRAYRDGRPSTTPCPRCGALLSVRDVPGISSLWVVCDAGHALAHVNVASPPSDE